VPLPVPGCVSPIIIAVCWQARLGIIGNRCSDEVVLMLAAL